MKNFTVSTYVDFKAFIDNMSFDRECLYVMESSALASYVKNSPQFTSNKYHVWTYEHLRNAIYPEYYNITSEWKMKTILRAIIEEQSPVEMKNKLLGQIGDIFISFQYYLLSGIFWLNTEFAADSTSRVIRQLYNSWTENSFIQQIYIRRITYDLKEITNRVNEFYKQNWVKNSEKDFRAITNIKKASFINLTSLDAPRFFFIKQLQIAGAEINFIIPRSGYQEPWKKMYSFIPKLNYTDYQIDVLDKTNKYTEYLKGNAVEIDHPNVRIKTYQNELEFKQQLKEKPLFQSQTEYENWASNEGYNADGNFKKVREYITFSKNEYNSLFNGVILNYNHKNKHYFNHISGKFLESLYELSWNDAGDDINMNFNLYRNIMVSGWVELKRASNIVNAYNCYDIFVDLEPYMKNVKSYCEIMSRIEKLFYLQEFSATFDEFAKDKTDGDEILKYLQNPLKVLPYTDNTRFSVTIKQLYELSKRLFSIVELLIPKSNRIILDSHMKELKRLWKSISHNNQFINDYKELSKNKKSIEFKKFRVRHKLDIAIFNRLGYMIINSDNGEYTLEEVKNFVQINTKIYKKSNQEELEINDMGDNLIKAFVQLEGIGINDTREIYITDLSEKSIAKYVSGPRVKKPYEQLTLLKKDLISTFYTEKEIDIILDQIKINKEIKLAFVNYYIGTVINNENCKVEFSYIKDIREHDQESSIFKILRVLFEKQNDDNSYVETRYELEKVSKEKVVVPQNTDNLYVNVGLARANRELNTSIKEKLSPVGLLDLDYCPKKFYYSNILSFYPVYREDFQQRLAFAAIAKLLKSQNKNSNDTQKYFYYLFPQWNRTLKDNLVDTTFPQNIREDVQFKNVKFPYDMKILQLLRSGHYYNTRTKRINAYRERENRADLYFNEFVKNELFPYSVKHLSGPFCNMCPHKMICTKGEFPIERYTYK